MMTKLQGIYALSDEILTPYSKLPSMLEEACKAGVKVFQFRDKTKSDQQVQSLCQELQAQCKELGVTFILNDRIDLAQKLNTSGLHIGKKETTPYEKQELQSIRKDFKGILGISCYGSLELAHQAKAINADYIAFGACFPSSTKPDTPTICLDIFKYITGITKCAIGGIHANNISQLANVDLIACINSIWQGNITQNIQGLYKNWKGKKLQN